MVKVALSVAYDGTSFRGWTDVRDSTLRPTLSRLLRQSELSLEVASRTDAGVHAFGNVCSFSCASPPRDLAQLTYSLNQLLPPEVCVTQISLPPPDFDVRETVGKEYRYHVNFAPRRQPLTRLYEWQVPARRGALAWDGASAAHAASLMLGRHSFAAFGNTPRGKERRAPVDASCALQMLQLRQLTPTVVQFRVRGDRFLYKMVRNIVGALVRVGQGELEHEELLHALEVRARSTAVREAWRLMCSSVSHTHSLGASRDRTLFLLLPPLMVWFSTQSCMHAATDPLIAKNRLERAVSICNRMDCVIEVVDCVLGACVPFLHGVVRMADCTHESAKYE